MTTRQDVALIYDGGRHALRQTRDGLLLYHTGDAFIGYSIAELGEFSKGEGDFLKANLRPGDTVVEVGANIGSLSIGMARQVGPQGCVHCYEPQRAVFQLLCANAALNNLEQIRPWNLAVDATPGTLHLPPLDYDRPSNFGGVAMQRHGRAGDAVEAVTLDAHLVDGEPGLTHLRLLKLDVEGMELEVLKGAVRLIERHRPIIYAENDRIEKSPMLLTWLMDAGYALYWHTVPFFAADNFYGRATDPFFERYGKKLGSVNVIGVPDGGLVAGRERWRITAATDWWTDASSRS